jgi:hypothetical protein
MMLSSRSTDEGIIHIGQEERRLYDQLHPTPAISPFRQPRMRTGRHGYIESSSDDDDDNDEVPVGLQRTPPSSRQQQQYTPTPPFRHRSAHVHNLTTPDTNMDTNTNREADSPLSLCAAYSTQYTPPSCDQIQRQARGGLLRARPSASSSASSTLTNIASSASATTPVLTRRAHDTAITR